ARRKHAAAYGDPAAAEHRGRLAMKARGPRGDPAPRSFRWRARTLLAALTLACAALLLRAVDLQLVDHSFLARQGDGRFSRVLQIAAHRGTVTDRYESG